MQERLFNLIESNELSEQELLDLIVEGVDINEPNESGLFPLTVACQHGDIAIIKLLLEFGATTIREIDGDGETALMIAYRSENMELLDLLLYKLDVLYTQEKHAKADYPLVQYLSNELELNVVKEEIIKTLQYDEEFREYPELLDAMLTVQYHRLAMDVFGEDTNDKIEYAVLEIGHDQKIKIEYLQARNWDYDDLKVVLKWSKRGVEQQYLSFDNSEDSKSDLISAFLKQLMQELELESVPLEVFLKFFILILSRQKQVYLKDWNDHCLYYEFING